ncbi:MAG: hypothetical protein ACYTEV_02840 [Planctomycetota bacterium]
MSHLPPMTRDELLELAPLDALGLLDEYDALLFSRGFHAAPESVQAEIRELQAAVAADETLLPDVTPPASLSGRVLAAVRSEVEASSDLAPLATIGRRRSATAAAAAAATLDRPGMVQRPTAHGGPIRPRRRLVDSLANHGWRAAAFALAAAVVVAMYFGVQLLDQNRELFVIVRQMQAEQATANRLNALRDGAGDAWLLQARKPATERLALLPSDPSLNVSGMAYIDPTSGQTSIMVHGLPHDESGDVRFTLSIRDAAGNEIGRAEVTCGPAIAIATLTIDQPRQLAGIRVEVIGPGDEVWLASA